MATFKCKMCGGSLEIAEGTTVCECEYCGTQQTLPRTDNEQTLNMFNRANHFRQQCEFDKAAEIYERMTAQSDDAELYWSIVLCRYGIEYVDDPLTHKKIATCHRTQFKSILEDADYLEALAHADSAQREVYEREAAYIDKVQKGILEISNKEKPFDVFICYKESDENGRRTQDSVLAQELYYQLEREGFKVFFSRITLESKLGAEYEPYIFAALNSAKVMVVVGTKPEYFNAVWVRNEWSRYLMLMQQDRSRTLIPAYKDMDPYDLPDALSMFQAQDMSKLGFMQDLIRGISKIARADEPKPAAAPVQTVVQTAGANTAPLLKRASLFLEDGDWSSANEYCNKVLDIDPECAQAYFYMLLAELKLKNEEELSSVSDEYKDKKNYKLAIRFADDMLKSKIEGYAGVFEKKKSDSITTLRKYIKQKNGETPEKSLAKAENDLVSSKNRLTQIEDTIPELTSVIAAANIEDLRKRTETEDKEYEGVRDEIFDLTKKITEEETRLKSLGLFKKKQKEESRERLETLKTQKNELTEKSIAKAAKCKELKQELNKYESDIKKLSEIKKEKDNLESAGIPQLMKQIESLKYEVENHVEVSENDYNIALDFILHLPADVLSQLPEDIKPILLSAKMKSVGEIVSFGKYKWYIISISLEYATLLCEDCITMDNFDSTTNKWQYSSLREMLNNKFYNEFSDSEKNMIIKSNIKTEGNDDTQDYIYLLSFEEAQKLDKKIRFCSKDWWLRTPGKGDVIPNSVMCISKQGESLEYWESLTKSLYGNGVRPALTIKLK